MSLVTDSRIALAYLDQDAVVDRALRLPAGIARELDALMSPAFRDRGRAAAVLRALAAAGRPLSRVRLGEELGIPASALGRTVTFLDENGFVTWTRRFGIGLGVRFRDCDGAFRSHLDGTVLRLVSPHLEMLARDHGATAFSAARAGASVVVVGAEGPGARPLLATNGEHDFGVITVADQATSRPWSRVEQNFSLPVRGIWATAREDGGVTIAARVTLAHSAVCIGLTTTTASLENYAIRCQALLESAGQLTSALRRQYPR